MGKIYGIPNHHALRNNKKDFTKGWYNRLSMIILEHKILNENNWMSLPEGSMQGPIYNVVKKQKSLIKKYGSCHKKAFNSVNTDVLRKYRKDKDINKNLMCWTT